MANSPSSAKKAHLRLPPLKVWVMAILFGSSLQSLAAPYRSSPEDSGDHRKTKAIPSSPNVSSPLDSAEVRKLYLDGDFDQAIDYIETALRYKGGFEHYDSVFMFKHLGVMYAAKYETREKGKLYMRKLLEVEPTARILDMYASDMIYMLFKNVQDEYDASHDRFRRADTTSDGGGNGPEVGASGINRSGGRTEGSGTTERKSGSSAYFWAGATVAVTAGVVTYIFFPKDPKTTRIKHEPD